MNAYVVFMWVPSMMKLPGNLVIPTGLVFASFMLAMSIGGMLFGVLTPIIPGGAETLCILVYIISAIAMIIPVYKFEFWWVYIAFLVLEGMVGMFNSCGATLRSRYYPDHIQSTIMSAFRVPLNLIVVLGTVLTDRASTTVELQGVFAVVVGLHLIAAGLQILLSLYVPTPITTTDATAASGANNNSNGATASVTTPKKGHNSNSNESETARKRYDLRSREKK